MESTALREPVAPGVKVTLIVQLLAAGTEVPQVFVSLKSVAFVPEKLSPAIFKVTAVFTFFSVTVIGALVTPTAWFPKLRLVGERDTMVPIPVSETSWGLPGALSAMLSEACRASGALGLNVTETVQLDCPPRLVPQVFVCAKAVGLVPLSVAEIAKGAAEILVRVTVCGALVVPIS